MLDTRIVRLTLSQMAFSVFAVQYGADVAFARLGPKRNARGLDSQRRRSPRLDPIVSLAPSKQNERHRSGGKWREIARNG